MRDLDSRRRFGAFIDPELEAVRADTVQRFVERGYAGYCPTLALPHLLSRLAAALIEQTGALNARFDLGGGGLGGSGGGGSGGGAGGPGGPRESGVRGGAGLQRQWPVAYGRQGLGRLTVWWPAAPDDAAIGLCEDLALRCGYLVKRHEVLDWARRRLGSAPLLIGTCPALHHLETFVERAAQTPLPVLVSGEFGTEKAQVAAMLHGCGPDPERPFVEVNCADPSGQPAQWFQQASGGTLFFNGIDELAPALQGQLPQFLQSRLGQWLVTPQAGEVRVVASTTADLARRVSEGRFSRALLSELDFLTVTVPPLRERPQDLRALALAALARHGFDAERVCTEALIAGCRRHAWPENLFELERAVARLAVMTGGEPVEERHLRRHAPWLAAEADAQAQAQMAVSVEALPERLAPPPPPLPLPASTSVSGDLELADVALSEDALSEDAVARALRAMASEASPMPLLGAAHWAGCVARQDAVALAQLHGGLRRALLHLGEHYADPLSLPELARQAHVSASHLGYLFRASLGTSFKPLLQQLRIEKAKALLDLDARARITEVALTVGFSELSHFERSFRRLVGTTPRAYRETAGRGLTKA